MIKRIFIEPNNINRDPIYGKIYNLIHHNGDKHITKESAEYFNNPDALGLGICFFVKACNQYSLVGFSGCKTHPEVSNSITVIAHEFRGLGIGNRILKEKIDLLPDFHTVVAKDNYASIKACEKAGLYQVGKSIGKRKDGEFDQLHFSKLNVIENVTPIVEETDSFLTTLFDELELTLISGG